MYKYNGTVRENGASRIVNVTVGGGNLPTFNKIKSNLMNIGIYDYLCYFGLGINLSVHNIWLGPIFGLVILLIFALQGNDFQRFDYLLCAVVGVCVSNVELIVDSSYNLGGPITEIFGLGLIFITLFVFATGGRNVLRSSPI